MFQGLIKQCKELKAEKQYMTDQLSDAAQKINKGEITCFSNGFSVLCAASEMNNNLTLEIAAAKQKLQEMEHSVQASAETLVIARGSEFVLKLHCCVLAEGTADCL